MQTSLRRTGGEGVTKGTQKKMLKKVYHRKEKLKGLYCRCIKYYYKKDGDE